jgi:uncharacterized membrane protein YuzA (DUF378 family)
MTLKLPDLTVGSLIWLLAEIGAVNWGLVALADTNLVTELLGSGNADLAYLVIGAAGAVAIIDKFTDAIVLASE